MTTILDEPKGVHEQFPTHALVERVLMSVEV